MDDLISRQAAIDRINKQREHLQPDIYPQDKIGDAAYRICVEFIERLPSAEPETAKRIVGKSRGGMTLWYQCDMCSEPVDAQDNYCRGCGRRLIDESDR